MICQTTTVPATTNVVCQDPCANNGDAGRTLTNILIAIIVFLIVLFIQALLVMLLWNWVIPSIFPGTNYLTFTQSLGLVLLIDVLSMIWAASPLVLRWKK